VKKETEFKIRIIYRQGARSLLKFVTLTNSRSENYAISVYFCNDKQSLSHKYTFTKIIYKVCTLTGESFFMLSSFLHFLK